MSRIVALARGASAVVLCMAATAAAAGTISLRWDAAVHSDLGGYRVFYGTSPGVYSSQQSAGLATAVTVGNLAECTTWYLAVKAYDAAGNESAAFSNEVSGWPQPIVSQVVPDHAEPGLRLTVHLTGANFQEGASLRFSDPAIVVHTTTVESCGGITADVTIGVGAAPGPVDVEVLNPDRVYGVRPGAFHVEGTPRVISTEPVDGAQDVDPGVSPRVVFSEPMLASSLGPDTVRLLAPDGAAVPQAPGSPTLSADGLVAVLEPSSNLAYGITYRIEVVGGVEGVLDLSGLAMDATHLQPNGFTVTSDLAGPVIRDVRAESVGSNGASILWTTDEPATSQVAWRRVGDAEYATTEIDPALGLSHEVPLSGLTPGISYEYHVRSDDGEGNSSQSSPDQTFTTPPGDCDGACAPCLIDAECPSGSHCDETTGTCAPVPEAPPLPIGPGAAWHFFRGADEPPQDWASREFDDSAWSVGPGGFGYGTDCTALHATRLNAMHGVSSSVYVRRKFHVDVPALIGELVLTVDYDAGFVAYLNGVEVARRNLAGAPPPHDAPALGPHGCSGAAFDPHAPEVIVLDPALLRAGTNVLALQGHEDVEGRTFTLAAELAVTDVLALSAEGDYDGDGRSDLAVYGSGRWSVRRSGDGGETGAGWGRAGDVAAAGDYDGDGVTDLAVVRQGQWIVRRSSDGLREVASWGEAGDRPVPGDYDGDGLTDLAVYRSGLWLVRNSADGTLRQEELGATGDVPVPGDYDGDGRLDPAVFAAGQWLVHHGSDGTSESIPWGIEGDLPAPHDFDGDGRTDLAVFRAGRWLVRRSSDLAPDEFVCGQAGGWAAPLRYDADAAADAATFQDGTWTLRPSTTGVIVQEAWGGTGDRPVSR